MQKKEKQHHLLRLYYKMKHVFSHIFPNSEIGYTSCSSTGIARAVRNYVQKIQTFSFYI